MSDPIDLVTDLAALDAADHIPPALAAPRRRRVKATAPVPALPEPPEPISFPEPAEAPVPPAAVSADIQSEDEMATTINDATDAARTEAHALFADMGGRAQSAMERGTKLLEEMGQLNRGNLDAVVESGRIAARGFASLGQGAADYARRSMEGASEAARSMAAVKSPTELLQVGGDYARAAFDQLVAEASRSTEAMLKLAGEVAQPLSNRAAVAADRMKAGA